MQSISFYRQGEFMDLCAGPHLMNTKDRWKAFKLTSLAGAYWRGNEKNKMLTRIYAYCIYQESRTSKSILPRIEEAKKRDHRKTRQRAGSLHDAAKQGPGFPFFLPKGMVLKNTLLDYWREIHKKAGYVGDFHPDHPEPTALGDLRSLGSLQRQHVHHRHR